ncbi:MAG: signal peptidase I [Clostridia bacterium]|nr:signal peptidase I [Clostridia bacterium]
MRDKANGYIYYDFHKKTEKEEIIETAWKSVFNWLAVIVGLLAVIILLWSMFFRVIEVDGGSMLPTLEDGDKVIVYTFNYTPEAGDIIVAESDYADGTVLVKRVIAKDGQTVAVDYDNDTVYVDSSALNEAYLYSEDIEPHDDEIEYPHTVQDGCLFLMGDNRNSSKDSRSTAIGDIDADYVLGKVVFRISSDYKIY